MRQGGVRFLQRLADVLHGGAEIESQRGGGRRHRGEPEPVRVRPGAGRDQSDGQPQEQGVKVAGGRGERLAHRIEQGVAIGQLDVPGSGADVDLTLVGGDETQVVDGWALQLYVHRRGHRV
nr:hypothetical protein GCM10020092_033030 [Actinoplanes digitatis]